MAQATLQPWLRLSALTLSAALCAALLPSSVSAQTPKPPSTVRPEAPEAPAASAGAATRGGTLVLIADGEPELKEKTVRTKLVAAANIVLKKKGTLKEGQEYSNDAIDVEQLSRESFEVLSRFILDGRIPGKDDASDVLSLRPYNKGTWALNLGGPYTLEKLVVEYERTDGNKEKPAPREFSPGQDDHVNKKALGVYTIDGLTSDKSLRPVRATVHRNDGLKSLSTETIEWPKENSYWQITLKDFDGDQAQLFEVLASDRFANPLVKKQVSERKLVLGSMLQVQRYSDIVFQDNSVTFRFFKPPGASPTRVWMKFPFSADEVDAQLARYQGFDEFELPEKIENPVLASSDVKLVPRRGRGDEGKWYEILPTADGQSYERKFELDQIDQWKAQAQEGQPVKHLIVWELEDPDIKKRQAYNLIDKATKQSALIRAEEVANWPAGVKRLESAP